MTSRSVSDASSLPNSRPTAAMIETPSACATLLDRAQQHQQKQVERMEESKMKQFIDITTPLSTTATSVNALAEQLREKLDVSWICVDLVNKNHGDIIMKSYADRVGMPLFGPNHHETGRHDPPRRGFADQITLALVKEDQAVTTAAKKLTQVYDTWQDQRFDENAYVQISPQRSYSVRFYAAMPIALQRQCCDNNGEVRHQVIGTLGVCHHQPKRLTVDEKALIEHHAVLIGHLLSDPNSSSRSRGPASNNGGGGVGGGGVKRARKRSTSRDDSDIVRRSNTVHGIILDGSLKSPIPKRRSSSCGPLPLVSIVPKPKREKVVSTSSLSSSPAATAKCSTTSTATIIENPLSTKVPLPDPKTSTVDPDEYLAQLVKALTSPTIQLQIQPSHEIVDYFANVTEEQMARYNVNVVSMARNNDLDGIKSLFATQGRDALDCYNRFGEGLLTLACRRGFRDMVNFFLSDEVHLPVRVRDDYGRTPVHDACWNPAPQLEICSWIIARDPSLFLLADKRGFTAFQYARQSDWHIWRQFLFDHADQIRVFVTQPDRVERFLTARSK